MPAVSQLPGRVLEILLSGDGQTAARVACPAKSIPAPGRYLLAQREGDLLPTPLFQAGPQTAFTGEPAGAGLASFLAAGPLPAEWQVGSPLALRGPLGRGFQPPPGGRRLALAALEGGPQRLLPLAASGGLELADFDSITLFCDPPLPPLPASIEVLPLAELPAALAWADFLALDLPVEAIGSLRRWLGLARGKPLACPAQALVRLPMPCAGSGECGACAVPLRRGYKLACQDGPVFYLDELDL
jgi:hypothetical protein